MPDTLTAPAYKHDPLMLDMRLYNGRERYPDDGYALRGLSAEDADHLRLTMGNAGLWHLETTLLRDVEREVARWPETEARIATADSAVWWDRVRNAPVWVEVQRHLELMRPKNN